MGTMTIHQENDHRTKIGIREVVKITNNQVSYASTVYLHKYRSPFSVQLNLACGRAFHVMTWLFHKVFGQKRGPSRICNTIVTRLYD